MKQLEKYSPCNTVLFRRRTRLSLTHHITTETGHSIRSRRCRCHSIRPLAILAAVRRRNLISGTVSH